MASKINKKYGADIKGTLCIENNILTMEVEDIDSPVNIADFFAEFNGKDVKITIAYNEEF